MRLSGEGAHRHSHFKQLQRPEKGVVWPGQATRFYLDDGNGRAWVPDGAIAYVRRDEKHFIVKNGFEIHLPVGTYTLAAERGPEYTVFRSVIEARAGEVRSIDVVLRRWVNMNRLGWYSGDLHNHRRPQDMPFLLLAEDLNLAPTLADWIWEDRPNSIPPPTTDAIRQVDATHVNSVLDKEVERLRNGPGAIDLLGLRSTIPFDEYLLYPPNDTFARKARAQRGSMLRRSYGAMWRRWWRSAMSTSRASCTTTSTARTSRAKRIPGA